MARTALTVQQIPAYGSPLEDITFTAADATNDHEFINDGKAFLIVKNDDASPKTVTVDSVANSSTFNREGDQDVVTAASSISIAGPFTGRGFNQTDGKVYVDLTDDTSLSLAVVQYTPTPV